MNVCVALAPSQSLVTVAVTVAVTPASKPDTVTIPIPTEIDPCDVVHEAGALAGDTHDAARVITTVADAVHTHGSILGALGPDNVNDGAGGVTLIH